MRMIREDIVTPEKLTSNVPVTEIEWTPGTYTNGMQRRVGLELYEVSTASTTDDPVTGEAKEPKTWVHLGKINRWRMFSQFIGEKTVHPSPLVVEIATLPTTSAIALFGVEATRVEVVTYSGGVETGRATKEMTNVFEVWDWGEFYDKPVTHIREGVILGLPSYGTDRMVITITNEGTPVAVGKVVVGEAVVIGNTLLNFHSGFRSFSRIVEDEWGGTTFTKRRTARICRFDIHLPALRAPEVQRQLEAADAIPTVYIGDPKAPESIVIGYFEDVLIERLTFDLSAMTLQIKGIT